MKRKALTLTLILSLLFSVAVSFVVNLATANPHPFPVMGDMPPDEFTKPPTIEIQSTNVEGNSICIYFKASIGESTTAEELRIIEVYTKSDWNQSNHYVFQTFDSDGNIQNESWITEFSYKLNVTGIPEGTRTITIFARELGCYYLNGYTYFFNMTGSSPTNFAIGTANASEEPFPTTIVTTASVASIAIIGVGLLVYFKKHNH